MTWEDTLKKYDWSKKPSAQPSIHEKYWKGMAKYFSFWEILTNKLASGRFTPRHIKVLALANQIYMPKFVDWLRKNHWNEVTNNLKIWLKEHGDEL